MQEESEDSIQNRPWAHSVQEPTKAAGIGQPSVFIKTYGCQMNVSDTELVASILTRAGYNITKDESADIVLLNTCAIREAAEQKVWGKVHALRQQQKGSSHKRVVGVLGCMAERLKDRLLDSQLVQLVAGAVRGVVSPCAAALTRARLAGCKRHNRRSRIKGCKSKSRC
jgi:tRNA A37 methylthiotransferase MiaB